MKCIKENNKFERMKDKGYLKEKDFFEISEDDNRRIKITYTLDVSVYSLYYKWVHYFKIEHGEEPPIHFEVFLYLMTSDLLEHRNIPEYVHGFCREAVWRELQIKGKSKYEIYKNKH